MADAINPTSVHPDFSAGGTWQFPSQQRNDRPNRTVPRIITQPSLLNGISGSLASAWSSASTTTTRSPAVFESMTDPAMWDPDRLAEFILVAPFDVPSCSNIRTGEAKAVARFVAEQKVSGRVFLLLSRADFEEMRVKPRFQEIFIIISQALRRSLRTAGTPRVHVRSIFNELKTPPKSTIHRKPPVSAMSRASTRRTLGGDIRHGTAESSPALLIPEPLPWPTRARRANFFGSGIPPQPSPSSTRFRRYNEGHLSPSSPDGYRYGQERPASMMSSASGSTAGMVSARSYQSRLSRCVSMQTDVAADLESLHGGQRFSALVSAVEPWPTTTLSDGLDAAQLVDSDDLNMHHIAIQTAVATSTEIAPEGAAATTVRSTSQDDRVGALQARLEELERTLIGVMSASPDATGSATVRRANQSDSDMATELDTVSNKETQLSRNFQLGLTTDSESDSTFPSSDTDVTTNQDAKRKAKKLARAALKGRLSKVREAFKIHSSLEKV